MTPRQTMLLAAGGIAAVGIFLLTRSSKAADVVPAAPEPTFDSTKSTTVTMAREPSATATSSSDQTYRCDSAGNLIDGVQAEKVSQWIDSLSDADVARQAFTALMTATPPCTVLANKAAVKAAQLDAMQAQAHSLALGSAPGETVV